MKVYWLLVLGIVGCTKRNPAVCCLDQADCDEAGLSGIRECATGLACVEHECVVPSCAMAGCEAAAPVCNITTDVCESCTDSTQCSRYSDTDVCDTTSGACVECVAASNCDPARPVCDANTCRPCAVDNECASGACDDNGGCVEEQAIVYLDPAGTDSGSCTRAAPCRTLAYALMQTSLARAHVVAAPGGYVGLGVAISPQTTNAPTLYIHGGGASFVHPGYPEEQMFIVSSRAVMRDLDLVNDSHVVVDVDGTGDLVLERVTIHDSSTALRVSGGSATLHDVSIKKSVVGVKLDDGKLTIDRVTVADVSNALDASSTRPTLDITNLMVWNSIDTGLNRPAIHIPEATGRITFSTVAASGTDAGSLPRGISCSSQLTIQASIVWIPSSTTKPPVAGCNLASSIVGPTSIPGASNVDPQFVDYDNRNFHLRPSSPARDVAQTGPAADIEGDPRPQGAGFDIGADEATP